MIFDLTGRVALVTGAGQNVGGGIAKLLAAQGAAVAVNDFVPERAQHIANDIGGSASDVRSTSPTSGQLWQA